MLDPVRERNALDGRVSAIVPERLAIAVAPDCARFSLRAPPEARDAVETCFGCDLPGRIGGLAVRGERLATCLGPDEWMLLAPAAEASTIAARLVADVAVPHSLVEVSHREVGIELRGSSAALALRAVCALELEAMPTPSATRTILDRAQVILMKLAPDHFRIEVWQSFATHVWDLLDAARDEIALDL